MNANRDGSTRAWLSHFCVRERRAAAAGATAACDGYRSSSRSSATAAEDAERGYAKSAMSAWVESIT